MGKIEGLKRRLLQSPATVGDEMGKPLRLFRRGGRWTFRAFVPQELRAIIGKREIWKSLAAGTGGGDGENRSPGVP
ncbi:DUF6538 domain-containing protein [Xanthobacter autotrophicus]|uniref:DUF6538 domain-containing protein n=1 Tax=Xanthobacter autotrophicus TaxID=280 RepID=UPI0037263EFB